jgi:hypothetical protein
MADQRLYHAGLLSADLPAPPKASDVEYDANIDRLSFTVAGRPGDLFAFYRDALGKAGWKPTTWDAVQDGPKSKLLFANPARDILTLVVSRSGEKLRGTLKRETAAESAHMARLAEAGAEFLKGARPKPSRLPEVDITLPAGAREVERSDTRIAFRVGAGEARAAVEALRAPLRQAGWKEEVATLEALFGTLSLRKDGGGLAVVYFDLGPTPAEVTISANGVVFEEAKAGAK